MKIALFVPSWPPGVAANGIVTYASHLVPALRRIGHDVYILTPRKTVDDNDPYTIDLRAFTPSPSILDRAMWKLSPARASFHTTSTAIANAIRNLVETQKIEVFEIEESFGWSFAVSRLGLLPVVVRLHGPWFMTGKFGDPDEINPINRQREELEARGVRHAQFVTANCVETLESMIKYYDLNLEHTRVIRTPIIAAAEARTWNLTTCKKDSFLFVGRFDKLKGGDLVLRAFAELVSSNSNLRLTFVGPDKGIRTNRGDIQHFDEFVRTNFPEGLRSRIEFRGQLAHADVMLLRANHFATIIAAQYDTMGYMLLEPMSLGCPLVTTGVGGIPEVIQDCRNGLLIASQDVKAMTDACQKLAGDPALASRLGKQAWQDCRELYSPENIARETAAVYQEAVDAFAI